MIVEYFYCKWLCYNTTVCYLISSSASPATQFAMRQHKKRMDLLYFLPGGLVVALFILRREFLNEELSFKIVLGISSSLFIIGVILKLIGPQPNPGSGAFLSPLIALLAYRLARYIFKHKLGREPRDTWLDWREGMGADRVFNILYFSLALLIWILMASFV